MSSVTSIDNLGLLQRTITPNHLESPLNYFSVSYSDDSGTSTVTSTSTRTIPSESTESAIDDMSMSSSSIFSREYSLTEMDLNFRMETRKRRKDV